MCEKRIRVALLGCGSVGTQVARGLLENRDELRQRIGASLQLTGIAVRDSSVPREGIPQELLTEDANGLVTNADIVIELMGGIEPAKSLIVLALQHGAEVVTANKALIAAHGAELFHLAKTVGAQMSYEAAVAGAIPIIRPLKNSLAGDRIKRIIGIVNGSTNYILDRMHRFGETQEEALALATKLGYAEADPTLDVEGFDAAQKAGILARVAFHTDVPEDAVYREGITGIDALQVQIAKKKGSVIKLLAIAERVKTSDQEGISVRVYPALISEDHPLAAVHDAKNAIFVESEYAGELMFYGAGAGGKETASSVLGDVVSVARRHVVGGPGISNMSYAKIEVVPIEQMKTRYQLILTVNDEPGVLQDVAGIFAKNNVSIARMEQNPVVCAEGSESCVQERRATLVIETHSADERSLAATVQHLQSVERVREIVSVLRAVS